MAAPAHMPHLVETQHGTVVGRCSCGAVTHPYGILNGGERQARVDVAQHAYEGNREARSNGAR